MSHTRRILPAVAALILLLAAARSVPTRAPSGDAWLLTVAGRPGGDSSTGMDGADQNGAGDRRRIAAAWGGSVRVLTGDFHAAESPAPDFAATRFLFVGRRAAGDRPAIWEMRGDGTGGRWITPGQGEPRDPAWMPDGRIVFSDVVEDGARALFACRPDGSDLQRLTFGLDRDVRPEVLDDGRIRFARIRVASGRTAEVVPMTIRPDGTGVARDTTTRDTREGAAAVPAAPAGLRLIGARRFVPRATPPILTSVIDLERRTGTLLCLDVRSSLLPKIARLERGAVARVRAEVLGRGTVLGEAPVHPDGSFLIEVPADTPLRLTLVGADGSDLASHDAGVWVRPKENRGCVGCHEPPDLAPENRRPRAVQEDPVRLTAGDPGGEGRHAPR